MRKIGLLFLLLAIGTIAFSQEITVRFTGQLNGTSYCRLDSVKVTNLTRDWTETVEYPDTIIVLGGTVGINLNIAATQGLGQNIPNPFDCETRVELSLSQRENVRMQLLDASGKQYADYCGSLDAGVHTFDISAANPQTYILNAVVGDKSYSIRMVNMGSGCGSSIKYAGISGSITAKLTTANEFHTGDNMRYVGYTTIGGQVVASDVKEQAQVVSQYVTLSFTNYSAPAVETLAATDITTTSAILHGNITYDGGTEITARGFYWGTAADNLSQMVSAESGAGTYSVEITGLSIGNTYYYCAFATNNIGTSIGEVISFETLSTTGTLNGHEWVDLGLPSGLLWATTNVGAENPEEYGDYFAWGETTTKESYNWSTYIYCNGSSSTLTKYCSSSSYGNNGFTDNLTTLEASDDAATANWGSGWRMPTQTEMQELIDNCTVTWTTQNGVNGRLFTGPNGNSIFLPAAGYRGGSELGGVGSLGNYWSSSLTSANPGGAWDLYFYSVGYYMYDDNRNYGQSVRPVCPSGSTSGDTTIVPPAVTTNTASSITATSATLSGNVTSDGGATVTDRGFYYGTSTNNLTQTVQSGSGTGSFTANLTDLASGTTYYYKAYATNSAGTSYGEVMSFTTEPVVVYPPTVITGTASNITTTSATISGNVTSDGGATVTERGFVYSTMSFILNLGGGTTVQCGNGTGSFSYNLIDLTDGTTYYYKAYATNSAGTAYGEVMSFTTLGTPTVTTGSASNITTTSATLSGNVTSDGGATVTSRGFLYGTSSGNLTQTVQSGNGTGSFTKSITGLSSYTTYYYKAYATNSAGTSYGEVMSFTTEPVVVYPPTVITGTASSITAAGVTLNGNVTSDGGATVTERGFVYSTMSFILNLGGGTTVQCGNGTGSFSANLTDLSSGTTYYYKAYATNSEGTEYGEVMSFTTEVVTVGTLNGHEWIDLGLPSGIKWATCNVGANSPTAYGDHYAWGETSTKSTYTEDNYTYSSNPTTLPSSADAATANWGTGWRMPTQTEMQELIDNCTVTWTTQNSVNGRLFTGPNGNSIFLPAAGGRGLSGLSPAGSCGDYWSSSLFSDYPDSTWYLYFNSDYYGVSGSGRYCGLSVRPVCAQ